MNCRFCSAPLTRVMIDLGATAVSNAFLSAGDLDRAEPIYPLKVFVCDQCRLAQVGETRRREDLFTADYVYASSVSKGWLEHCRRNVEALVSRFSLGPASLVVEVASNDGYLLQFVRQAGVPCLGIEPTESTARLAREKGLETLTDFFDEAFARRLAAGGRKADVVIGNNVLAHVPDLNAFVAGFPILLKEEGVLVLEFPHLHELLSRGEFDTIYHEHYSYFSFATVRRVMEAHGLRVFDVETLPTHGGSLRLYACRQAASHRQGPAVDALLKKEHQAGVETDAYTAGFQEKAQEAKNGLLKFLIAEREAGRTVVGFGAAAKGNTFLNYAGVKPDLLAWVGDDTPFKQGKFLPQSRIPVVSAERVALEKPQTILILPWNFRDEIAKRLDFARAWGARFAVAVPRLEVF
ncbi:MAG: class I SAM-dependent methyltransferase [Spirochaetes bacterium]|nr:class I SAM-dependent methyltransferase [Spirochaetota bacterium]